MPRRSLYPHHVLLGILVNAKRIAKEKGIDLKFRAYEIKLSEIFYNLKIDQRMLGSKLLELFVFSNTGPEPVCPLLHEGMKILHHGGSLARPDLQDPEVFVVTESGEDYFDSVIKGQIATAEQIEEMLVISYTFLDIYTCFTAMTKA